MVIFDRYGSPGLTASESRIRFFVTDAHACSYLEGEKASTLFIDPEHPIDGALYSQLSRNGFRRSGAHIYRPHCSECDACIPIRTVANNFSPNRRMRRIKKRNSDIKVTMLSHVNREEHYQLYERYINLRHQNGDMFPPSREQFESFLSSEWDVTHFIEYRLDDQLIAASVTDQLDDGLSAIYTYFDPDQEHRSLGVYAILTQLDMCIRRQLPYLYLGYWIKACQKMSYKIEYRPCQIRVKERWVTLN
jgi:leucyl-tRNA---protein transferase